MKALYHGNRNKTIKMLQEELFYMESYILVTGEYTNAHTKVNCECIKCGYKWASTANRLLASVGCNNCADRINPALGELQNQLNSLGKNFTIHELDGEYLKSTQKLKAVCNDCGNSWESISGVLRRPSTSCKICSIARKEELRNITFEEKLRLLVENANPKINEIQFPKEALLGYSFEDKYYSEERSFILLEPFISFKNKILVECKVCHMRFNKLPQNALDNGCANCSNRLKKSIEIVQKELDEADRKISVRGEYRNSHTKLLCTCNICNYEWEAHQANLIHGKRGCPSCARTGFDPSKPGILYYLRVEHLGNTYWKIGITNLSVRKRFRPQDRKKITTLYSVLFEDGNTAQLAERNIKSLYKCYRYHGPDILKTGNTELFTKDILQMNHLYWGDIL